MHLDLLFAGTGAPIEKPISTQSIKRAAVDRAGRRRRSTKHEAVLHSENQERLYTSLLLWAQNYHISFLLTAARPLSEEKKVLDWSL